MREGRAIPRRQTQAAGPNKTGSDAAMDTATARSGPRRLRIALGQLGPRVGDLDANADKAIAAHARAREAGADLVALPEMFLAGYQPQDLVLKPAFLRAVRRRIERLAAACADGPALGIGAPDFAEGRVWNAWFVLEAGAVKAVIRKHELPNYGVFDEKRLYAPAEPQGPVSIRDVRVGVPICEDAWTPEVCETLAETGAEILLAPNGSPYERGKLEQRHALMVARVIETGLPLIYLNMTGGQDDQVFDGGSFALARGGRLALQMPLFDEAIEIVELEEGDEGWRFVAPAGRAALAPVPGPLETDYRAMVEGTRDYAAKTGFSRALLGLSGGVDSALVAAVAADALGPGNVRCVMLPSRYTSAQSLEDAATVARALGCALHELPIEGAVEAVGRGLAPFFAGLAPDVTEENIQSRLRGLYLMALSNKFGELLLSTGNKSELAVGYATLYGDMNGGWNPLKDVYKSRVFALCRWRNAHHRPWMLGPAGEVIAPRIIDKPPSAELREGQRDEDSLPPYERLDAMLEMLIEQDAAIEDLVAAGHDRAEAERVEGLLLRAEYKRFQSAPGPKLGPKAFWLDRRYPIANAWRDRE
ncbi:NAD+ synthase [Oceanicella actignis]|uniref:Glutamine-dependent NAD(+) synthetase n=2 Tax=Oceanicella actignis TaxID=1189325 RepID=A0A1M7RUQ9_9RHOB|nr:NAD+ synthase [Oceanicella actignis]SHN50029.1 NAD+ synthase [Oceanicella actignis]